MGIKSILVHLDGGRNAQARVAAAAALALRLDAHLLGLAPTGWLATPPDGAGVLGFAAYEQAALDALRRQAETSVQRFHEQAARLGVRACEGRAAMGYAGDAMSRAALYCDLIVVSQQHPDEPAELQSPQLLHEVLLRAGRPLLVLPFAGECEVPAAPRVLVAWNGSREAVRAVHDALPLLTAAASVEVVAFGEDSERPADDLAAWLARHGVTAKLDHVPVDVGNGEALLSHAADMGAQLIVAGGYGHSRLREAVLGGVTRTLLASSPVPVLLSH